MCRFFCHCESGARAFVVLQIPRAAHNGQKNNRDEKERDGHLEWCGKINHGSNDDSVRSAQEIATEKCGETQRAQKRRSEKLRKQPPGKELILK